MSNSSIKPEIKIKDIMSTPVKTVKETEKVSEAAKKMDRHGIGGIIVVDRKGKPVGIITERDIVKRVVAKNLHPSKVKAASIMSEPLATISPNKDISEAAKTMRRLKIRRLAVMEETRLVGVITSKDIVDITPALIDVIVEKSQITGLEPSRRSTVLAGHCDKCATWSENLVESDGIFLCEDCLADVEEENKVY